MLELLNINRSVDGEYHAHDISATFTADSINLLLGPTGSGKTTLMRLLAGLDSPDSGIIRFNGKDITRLAVQKRNVAMVYQQFINYPSLTVLENIASPLHIARVSRTDIARRVEEAAILLKISPYLQRLPAELSGGQQQRVALARALVKNADIVLLDEPLANLDYKLREELRTELPKYFRAQGAVLLYATTEPTEALLLGGQTAVMHEGAIAQLGPTADVFHQPRNLVSARAFSDPPLNVISAAINTGQLEFLGVQTQLPPAMSALKAGAYTLALRPYHLRLSRRNNNDIALSGRVVVNEITGSESYLHIDLGAATWISLVHAIRSEQVGQTLTCYVDPADFFVFDCSSNTLLTPPGAGT